MGKYAVTVLAYGYDLGDADNDMADTGTNDGDDAVDLGGDPDGGTFLTTAIRALYDSIPDAPAHDDYWDPAGLIAEMLGVRICCYASSSRPFYLLTAFSETIDAVEARLLDPHTMAREPVLHWNNKLAHALTVLGRTAPQPAPRWLVASCHD